MKTAPLRIAATLVIAVAVAGFDHVAQGSIARSDRTDVSAVPSNTLGVTFGFCDSSYCSAQASGGSGGYSFEWWGATEWSDYNGSTTAQPTCPTESPVSVRVTVTDSQGATAWAEQWVSCGPPL